jgi:hypothetical protein
MKADGEGELYPGENFGIHGDRSVGSMLLDFRASKVGKNRE